MKTNIKMKCDDNQFRKVMNILKIDYKSYLYYEDMYIIINNDLNVDFGYGGTIYNDSRCEEIDADLFIRTSGTCEENQLKDFIQSQNKNIDRANDWIKQFNDVSLKLKKKNEILKKARIKRKNQREELHKLNLKLQKCISLEKHNKKIESIEFDLNMFKSSNKLRGDLIEKLELENTEMCKLIENINKDNASYLSNNILSRDKEIEKLKAVIEYLESKTK